MQLFRCVLQDSGQNIESICPESLSFNRTIITDNQLLTGTMVISTLLFIAGLEEMGLLSP